MNILLTNDDGIFSPAIPRMAEIFGKYGEVTVIAPKKEQSGKSQTIEFRNPIEIKQVEYAPGKYGYAVDSTPADCVRYGIVGLKKQFDLVVSGMNIGYNLGDDIAYSGTAGAVLEGARLGVRGMAFSAEYRALEVGLAHLPETLEWIFANGLPEQNVLYNVNFPPEIKGIRITKQGGIYYHDEFIPQGNDLYLQVGAPLEREFNDLTVDIDAVLNGYISITPLTAEKTAFDAFERLKHLTK